MKLENLLQKTKNAILLAGSLIYLNSCSPLVIKDFDKIYKKDFPMAELEISKFGSQIDYQNARNISVGKNGAIAFEYAIDDANSDILLIKDDKIYRITDFPGYEGEPQINAEETKIVFTSDKEESSNIFLAELKNKKLIQLTKNKTNYNPSINADGTKISYTGESQESDADIYLIDLEKKEITNLSNGEFGDYQSCISGDGNRIAFISEQKGSSIFIKDARTDELILINQNYNKKYFNPKLNYDGAKIVYEEKTEANESGTILFKNLEAHTELSWPLNKGYDGEPNIDSAGNFISWISRQAGVYEKKKFPFDDKRKKVKTIRKDEYGNIKYGLLGSVKFEYKKAEPKIKIVNTKTGYSEVIENQIPKNQMGTYISTISQDGKKIIVFNKENKNKNYQIENPLCNQKSEIDDALLLEKSLRGK